MKVKFLAAGLVAALLSTGAAAQYPNKPIRMIVPFPPGGAADLSARIFSQPLGQALGQSIVLEHRPGADGAIAGDAVLKAAPDGYTLFYGTATGMSAMPNLRKVRPYDPVNDFTPVSMVGIFGFFVFAHPGMPVHTIQDLIGYVRANPGKLNYASGNLTSVVATAQFASSHKLNMTHIPYKGDAPATVDLLAGRVHMMIAAGSALAQSKDGRLRVLATMLERRSPLAPNVPTLAEAGLQRLPIAPWGALFGPGKMSREITDRLAREMAVVMARKDVRDQLDQIAFEARSSSPEELRAWVRTQLEVWGRTIREIGLPQE